MRSTGRSTVKHSRQYENQTAPPKAGVTSSPSLEIALRIAMDQLLDFLCEAPLTRNLPGIRYLAPRSFEKTTHHYLVKIPLENARTSDIQLIHAGQTITVIAPGYHENGAAKLHWSEGTSGYGTWRRRYRMPGSANPATVRVVPGRNGAEIVADRSESVLSIAA